MSTFNTQGYCNLLFLVKCLPTSSYTCILWCYLLCVSTASCHWVTTIAKKKTRSARSQYMQWQVLMWRSYLEQMIHQGLKGGFCCLFSHHFKSGTVSIKPAVFLTSFCTVHFSGFGVALWVSGSTIWFLGAQRTFDSFNVAPHSVVVPPLLLSRSWPLPSLAPMLITDFPPSSSLFFFPPFSTTSCPYLSSSPSVHFTSFLCLFLSSVFHAFISFPTSTTFPSSSFQVKRFLTFVYYRNPLLHTLLCSCR